MANKRFEWDAQTACFAACFSRPSSSTLGEERGHDTHRVCVLREASYDC